MSIKDYQETVDKWIKEHGVRYFNELTNMALLTEEVGEFSRLVARTYGEQSFKHGREPANIKSELAEELADILFVLACLANQMDIDITDALNQNMLKKSTRDKDRHTGNPKLH